MIKKNYNKEKMGLYGEWTLEEKNNYKRNYKHQLTDYYLSKGAPRSDPEKRVICLTESLKPFGMNIETDTINLRAIDSGKAHALNLLEEIALTNF